MSDPATPADLTAHWQQKIDQWKDSGQSQARFCQANELPYPRFLFWRRKLEGDTGACRTTQARGGFAAVDYRHDASSGLTLSLPSGLVPHGISAGNVPVVRQLLESL